MLLFIMIITFTIADVAMLMIDALQGFTCTSFINYTVRILVLMMWRVLLQLHTDNNAYNIFFVDHEKLVMAN